MGGNSCTLTNFAYTYSHSPGTDIAAYLAAGRS